VIAVGFVAAGPTLITGMHLLLAIVAEGRGDAAEQRRQLDAAVAGLPDIQEKVVYGAILGDACARAGSVTRRRKLC